MDFHCWEKSQIADVHALFLLRLLSSIFQLKFLSETKMTNDLKFKTRETATTTSPFYTRRHRESISTFSRRRNSVKKLQKARKRSRTQFTLTLFIRGLLPRQNQSWLSYTVTVLVAYGPYWPAFSRQRCFSENKTILLR